MDKYELVEEFLKDEDAEFRTERFQSHESLERLVKKLKSAGAGVIGVLLCDDAWEGELNMQVPKVITPELLVAVADSKPDECGFETIGGIRYIRMWWD